MLEIYKALNIKWERRYEVLSSQTIEKICQRLYDPLKIRGKELNDIIKENYSHYKSDHSSKKRFSIDTDKKGKYGIYRYDGDITQSDKWFETKDKFDKLYELSKLQKELNKPDDYVTLEYRNDLKNKIDKLFTEVFELNKGKLKNNSTQNSTDKETIETTSFKCDFTKTELIELIAALYATKKIKNTSKEKFAHAIFKLFGKENEFNRDSLHATITQFKSRCGENTTKFIDSLSETLKENLSK